MRLLGVSFERGVRLHRWVGVCTAVLTLVHGGGMIIGYAAASPLGWFAPAGCSLAEDAEWAQRFPATLRLIAWAEAEPVWAHGASATMHGGQILLQRPK